MLLSSPQQRAVTTAEEIAAAQAAAGRTAPAVEVHAALQNRDWGALEGTPASQVRLLDVHPAGFHIPLQARHLHRLQGVHENAVQMGQPPARVSFSTAASLHECLPAMSPSYDHRCRGGCHWLVKCWTRTGLASRGTCAPMHL